MKHKKLLTAFVSMFLVLAVAGGVIYGFRDALFGEAGQPGATGAKPGVSVPSGSSPDAGGTPGAEPGANEQPGSSPGSSPGVSGPPGAGQEITAEELSHTIREKYDDNGPVSYKKPLFDLPKDQVFFFDLSIDPFEAGFRADELDRIVNVFLDAGLQVSAKANLSYDAQKGRISVAPPAEPVFEPIGGYDFSEFAPVTGSGDWGYANRYYFAEFYTTDGEPLDKPRVTIFTIQRELKAPQNVGFFKDEGSLALRWSPVEGADGYIVYKTTYRYSEMQKRYTAVQSELSEGKMLKYTYPYVYQMTFYTEMNMAFYFENISENPDPFELSVVAVGGGGASSASDPVYSRDILSVLPHTIDFFAYEDDAEMSYFARDVGDLGLYRLVEMCDHSKVKMPVTYLIDETKVVNMHDEYPTSYEEDFYVLYIPYEVKGTSLRSTSVLLDYDYPELRDDLLALKAREDEVASNGGRIDVWIRKDNDEESGGDAGIKLSVAERPIFATNALSEYLAISLIGSAQKISLAGFPESYNTDHLANAFLEAMYQNPYVLGVKDIRLGRYNNLIVEYEDSQPERERKQNEIQAEVTRVAAEIIKPDMTDLQKEIAINDYLCESAVYDFDALENAEKYDFKYVDPEFNDSFNAYGILVKKKGVCASFAAAFKLLADEAGLDCIVITGYLYGDLAHAWNRVLIDGEWMTVDSTNNGSETLRNPILNLPDRVARTILVEDNYYVLAANIGNYTGEAEEVEYYRIEGKFYSQSLIVDMLAEGLARDGSVTLRTDYDLSDRQYNNIVQAVLRSGGYNNAYCIMWLGTIYMELSR